MGSADIQADHIVQDEGICGGKPRIAGTRMKVQHIVLEHFDLGWSVKQICAEHPGITAAQVRAALSFYYENRSQIDLNIKDDREFAQRAELAQRTEAGPN